MHAGQMSGLWDDDEGQKVRRGIRCVIAVPTGKTLLSFASRRKRTSSELKGGISGSDALAATCR